jgi:hypothetical protein
MFSAANVTRRSPVIPSYKPDKLDEGAAHHAHLLASDQRSLRQLDQAVAAFITCFEPGADSIRNLRGLVTVMFAFGQTGH